MCYLIGMPTEELAPGEHAWYWDGDEPDADLFCINCYLIRDFSVAEEAEPQCPDNPKQQSGGNPENRTRTG